MTDPIHSVSLLVQSPGAFPHVFTRIRSLLRRRHLQRVRFAVAYANWGGVGLISRQLESFLDNGGTLQTVFGVANGVTTPDSLLYSLYLQELYPRQTYAGAMEDKYANATFHPKFFEFKLPNRTIAMIGSANLTGAGMSRNTEIGLQIDVPNDHPLATRLEDAWSTLQSAAKPVTPTLIRASNRSGALGEEAQKNETRSNKAHKPLLTSTAAPSPKPLFSKVLDLDKPRKRAGLLSNFDTLTEPPSVLYLQILTKETGGRSTTDTGYQVQFPVATIGAYFGVGEQERTVKFNFGGDVIENKFSHFQNHTHRIRLSPVRDEPRPLIVRFERVGPDEYDCTVLTGRRYTSALTKKCTQQTRKNSRLWGLE